MLSVTSWNVNSILGRLSLVLSFISSAQPDVLLLQELKCTEDKFPYEPLEDLGYNCLVSGQKSYNGVAIISKYPIEKDTSSLLPGDDQARYLEALVSKSQNVFRVASIYVPNGREVSSPHFQYKLDFFDAIISRYSKLLSQNTEALILGGDFNVAPEDRDVFDPIKMKDQLCFHFMEKQKFNSLINLGLVDSFRIFNQNSKQFTWWDYRAGSWQKNQGMRLDHFLLSPEATDIVKDCRINSELRGMPKPSDHCPITLDLSLKQPSQNFALKAAGNPS